MARLAGFEPAAHGLEVRSSIHLSYRRLAIKDTTSSIFRQDEIRSPKTDIEKDKPQKLPFPGACLPCTITVQGLRDLPTPAEARASRGREPLSPKAGEGIHPVR